MGDRELMVSVHLTDVLTVHHTFHNSQDIDAVLFYKKKLAFETIFVIN